MKLLKLRIKLLIIKICMDILHKFGVDYVDYGLPTKSLPKYNEHEVKFETYTASAVHSAETVDKYTEEAIWDRLENDLDSMLAPHFVRTRKYDPQTNTVEFCVEIMAEWERYSEGEF